MSNYVQVNDYSAKDGLATGDPNKAIKGSDVDAEFGAISTAITSKADTAGDTFTGDITTLSVIATNAAGPKMLNETASATNATFLPNKANPKTGYGWAGTDLLALICNDIEVARIGLATFTLSSAASKAWKGTLAPRNTITGVTMSRDTDTDHDTLIAVGEAKDSTNAQLIELTTAITKQIDSTWIAGDDAGGIAAGITVGNDTWYHVFLILDVTNDIVDAGYDTSVIATNLLADATDYTLFRRIGSVLTDGTANIIAYRQTRNHFEWSNPPLDVNRTTDATSEQTGTLSVPPGVEVRAAINGASAGVAGNVYVHHPDIDDEVPAPLSPGTPVAPLYTFGASTGIDGTYFECNTDTSQQIQYRTTHADIDVHLSTLGYYDHRGED